MSALCVSETDQLHTFAPLLFVLAVEPNANMGLMASSCAHSQGIDGQIEAVSKRESPQRIARHEIHTVEIGDTGSEPCSQPHPIELEGKRGKKHLKVLLLPINEGWGYAEILRDAANVCDMSGNSQGEH